MTKNYIIEHEWQKVQDQFSKLRTYSHWEKLFYPCMKEINLPIASCFTWQAMNSSEIIIRDGLAPLLWFLLLPSKSRQTLYINSSFAPFIPEIFKKDLKYYTLRTKNNTDKPKGKMVTGHYVTHWSSLLLWKKRLPPSINKSLFSLSFERNNQGVESLDPDWWKFYDKHLSKIIKLPLKQEFGMGTSESEFSGYTLINLEDYLTVGLSYKEWRFAICGGDLPPSSPIKSKIKVYPLSANLELVLHDSKKKCILNKSDIQTLTHFTHEHGVNMPTNFYHYIRFLGEKYEQNSN